MSSDNRKTRKIFIDFIVAKVGHVAIEGCLDLVWHTFAENIGDKGWAVKSRELDG